MMNTKFWAFCFSVLSLLLSCDAEKTTGGTDVKVAAVEVIQAVEETDSLTMLSGRSVDSSSSTTTAIVTNTVYKGQSIFAYNFKKPITKLKLSNQLREISGVAYQENRNRLLAVNDEVGRVYILDEKDGRILEKKKFSGPGDYEDIVFQRDRVYILKSNGKIYSLDSKDMKLKEKMDTDLSISNDVEGMCFDPQTARLLLACKGSPDLKRFNFSKKIKNVFSFNPVNGILNKNPILRINKDSLENFVEVHYNKKKKKLKKKIERVRDIAPSAIGVHPIENRIYVLSSNGKLLVVFNRDESIAHIEFLDSKDHRQPEGLSFASNGDLFISNEGKGGTATVQKFRYVR